MATDYCNSFSLNTSEKTKIKYIINAYTQYIQISRGMN